MSDTFIREENGVLKIHAFEKHYITLVLQERLNAEQATLDKALADKEWMADPLSQGAVVGFKRFIADLAITLKRVQAMPEIRW